ncbi:MAG: hypothetical protein C0436_01080 [Alphaproteobacteria bacterium]|nr:hypothetical protein [Alphaproteobacteria bacterium]
MFAATKEDDKVKDVKLAGQKAKADFRDSARDARDAAEDFGTELKSAAHRTGRSVREFLHTASDEVSHVTDNVASQIRNKPVQSTLIALAAGFIVGAIVRR